MSKQLTSAAFCKAETSKVELQELGGHVFLKKLSVKDVNNVQHKFKTDTDKANEMLRISVVDKSGELVFPKTEDVKNIQISYFKLISGEIMEFNGLTERRTEEIRKN